MSRPGIVSSLRRKVLALVSVVDVGAPSSWVQRMRLWARVVASSQVALAVNTPEGHSDAEQSH